MSGLVLLGAQYAPLITAHILQLRAENVDYEQKGTFLVFFIILCIIGYSCLWIEYLLLGIFIAYFSINWVDKLGATVGQAGDTVFLPLFAVTNLAFVGVAMFAPPVWLLTGSMMVLEGIHSSFNAARVTAILQQPNRTRGFHPVEVLFETIMIEIAPVTLLAHWTGMINEWDPWDQVGAVCLIPLAGLLVTDFNVGKGDDTTNQEHLFEFIKNVTRFLFDNVENIVLVMSVIAVVFSGPRRR